MTQTHQKLKTKIMRFTEVKLRNIWVIHPTENRHLCEHENHSQTLNMHEAIKEDLVNAKESIPKKPCLRA